MLRSEMVNCYREWIGTLKYFLYLMSRFWAVSAPDFIKHVVVLMVSRLYFIFNRKERTAVFCNLRNVCPEKDIYGVGWKVFHNFGQCVGGFPFCLSINQIQLEKVG